MTREEIINGLKMSMELTLFDPSTGEVMEPRQLNDINRTSYEAYKGAIELLEKQPDTTTHDSIPAKTGKNDGDRTSGDCISRQQAIDALCSVCNALGGGHNCDKTKFVYNAPFDEQVILCPEHYALTMLPSAQPERKTGRWIPCPQNASWLYVYKCSECGGYLQISDVDGKGYKANYCSYCGTKMEGGEQDGMEK